MGVFLPGQIYTQWTVQQLPTTESLRDVYFADTSNGWVAGIDGIFHTLDGGLNWERQYALTVGHISGLSRSEFWASGQRDTLLHSIDAGGHFTKVPLGRFFDLDSIRGIVQVYFLDSVTGWAAATGWNGFTPRLVKTTDRGRTWNRHDVNRPYFNADLEIVLIEFVNTDTGWVAGDLSPVFGTTNGGITWDSLSSVGYATNIDMQFVTKDIGWISTAGPVISTEVHQTTDGGKTWGGHFLGFQCSAVATHLRFTDTSNGWVAQTTCIDSVHTEIWHTSDGGAIWNFQHIFAPSFFYRANKIFFVDEYHGWIAGEHGIVLRTTNGGITAVKEEPGFVPSRFSLSQNFPNPFNPLTTFTIAIPERSHVKVVVYDMLGREVKTILTHMVIAGINEMRWDGKNNFGTDVSTGIYFYRITAVSASGKVFTASRKMMLMR